eukprot:ANDGO_04632.mRNA.1 hypothetical protein
MSSQKTAPAKSGTVRPVPRTHRSTCSHPHMQCQCQVQSQSQSQSQVQSQHDTLAELSVHTLHGAIDYKHEYERLKSSVIPKYRSVIEKAREHSRGAQERIEDLESVLAAAQTQIEALKSDRDALFRENVQLREQITEVKHDLKEALELLDAREEEQLLGLEIDEIDNEIEGLATRLSQSIQPPMNNNNNSSSTINNLVQQQSSSPKR